MTFSWKYLISFTLLLAFQYAVAQHIGIDKRALAGLASEERINVIFSYNELSFNGKHLPEAEFLQHIHEKVTKYGDLEMAEKWVADYKKAKKQSWPETFISKLNSDLGKLRNAPAFVLNDTTTKYTVVVHTHWMNFGYDAGIVKRPAKASMDIYFYKTSDAENYLSLSKLKKREGLYNDSRYRNKEWPRPSLASMRNVYERVAPNLAKALKRVVKK
ncbi:hypothetical protein [Ulvibacter litoralis]|uniref:DUF4468 domain-containing protein n=1 Tax=Ulvibacter litoralis TaxID=227084 RepID=A0A1G7GQ35_9FLAO|nr:hypothetical protein [Ulvibacter litoralis]GHC55463.1 hypothetical protein GCM10008083_19520 [Ulvibacter litoralis]SDE90247.1 hypothetical protein SAMN05421855_103271 [Ulvibacter litoralis]